MASTQKYEYEIIIRVPGADGESADSPPVASKESDAKKKPQAAEKNVGRYIASQTIMPMVHAATTAVTSNIGLYTGSKELQQRVDFAQRALNTVTGTISNSFAATAITGSVTSGIGIGVLLSVIQIGISTATKAVQLQIGKMQENEQLQLARQRYSPAYNGSRGG